MQGLLIRRVGKFVFATKACSKRREGRITSKTTCRIRILSLHEYEVVLFYHMGPQCLSQVLRCAVLQKRKQTSTAVVTPWKLRPDGHDVLCERAQMSHKMEASTQWS